jgi:hypothetical protein
MMKPQRPRIAIDMSQGLSLAISELAGKESVKQGKRITKRDIILDGLQVAFPELTKLVEENR